MCKYCDENKMEAIWFKKKNIYKGSIGEYEENEKMLGAIFDFESEDFFRKEPYLSIEKEKGEWFEIYIKYCPFCGKKLKRKTLSGTIRMIISYCLNKKTEREIYNGNIKCSICDKKINYKENVIINNGIAYHYNCKNKETKNEKRRN